MSKKNRAQNAENQTALPTGEPTKAAEPVAEEPKVNTNTLKALLNRYVAAATGTDSKRKISKRERMLAQVEKIDLILARGTYTKNAAIGTDRQTHEEREYPLKPADRAVLNSKREALIASLTEQPEVQADLRQEFLEKLPEISTRLHLSVTGLLAAGVPEADLTEAGFEVPSSTDEIG